MAEFAFLSDLGFSNPPPVPMPRTVIDHVKDDWVPWPAPRNGQAVPALTDETGSARASLSCITKSIVPLRRHFLNAGLTQSYLDAALKVNGRLATWWDSLHPSFRSFDVPDKAPPHFFMVA